MTWLVGSWIAAWVWQQWVSSLALLVAGPWLYITGWMAALVWALYSPDLDDEL